MLGCLIHFWIFFRVLVDVGVDVGEDLLKVWRQRGVNRGLEVRIGRFQNGVNADLRPSPAPPAATGATFWSQPETAIRRTQQSTSDIIFVTVHLLEEVHVRFIYGEPRVCPQNIFVAW